MKPLAQDHAVILRSPDPARIFVCSPGIARLPSGRLVVTDGLRSPHPGLLSGPTAGKGQGAAWQARIFTSDDGGRSWQHRADAPIVHARPFEAGGRVYVLGHDGDLAIIASDDGGETWSERAFLTDGQFWHQAPCNVHYAHGCVYLVMERRVTFDIQGWYVGELAPVLLRAPLGADLTRRESWTFASELSFRDAVRSAESEPALEGFGVPFYSSPYPRGGEAAPGRTSAPIGWLETNVVQFTDPDHLWHDPTGRTCHLWMRAHTGGTGYAAVAKVMEEGVGTGAMRTSLQAAPSGRTMLFVPCPGGQMKFHILHDGPSGLFWLLSTQATDSMRRPDRLPPDRYNLPNNERRRLQLHFSRNCIDWCFAGLVAAGEVERASRHYAAMVVDGDDLCAVSRSGDGQARSAHDGNIVTFHRVRDFRGLVY